MDAPRYENPDVTRPKSSYRKASFRKKRVWRRMPGVVTPEWEKFGQEKRLDWSATTIGLQTERVCFLRAGHPFCPEADKAPRLAQTRRLTAPVRMGRDKLPFPSMAFKEGQKVNKLFEWLRQLRNAMLGRTAPPKYTGRIVWSLALAAFVAGMLFVFPVQASGCQFDVIAIPGGWRVTVLDWTDCDPIKMAQYTAALSGGQPPAGNTPVPPLPTVTPSVPPLVTPLPLQTPGTGATKVVQGPAEVFSATVGVWYHMNLACQGCEAGEEVNFVFLTKNSGTVTIDGTVWSYDHEPTFNDELCDPRDHWPAELPEGWPEFGDLVFPCSVR